MIKSYYKVYKVYPDPEYVWLKNEYTSATNFITGSEMTSPINLEYSLDKTRWNNYDMSNKPTISVPAGDYIYLRGVNSSVTFSDTLSLVFSLDQNFSTGGDIRTLLNYQDVNSVTKIPDYAFYCCFLRTKITSCTWDMSGITEVGWHGLDSCFNSCIRFTTPPEFPNLTTVGDMGLSRCFYKCTSLTTGPDFSKVTRVGNSGFDACFRECEKLTQATAPKVTTWDRNKFYYWLANVASYGVVRKPTALTIPRDVSSVPEAWNTENY